MSGRELESEAAGSNAQHIIGQRSSRDSQEPVAHLHGLRRPTTQSRRTRRSGHQTPVPQNEGLSRSFTLERRGRPEQNPEDTVRSETEQG